MKKFKPFSTVLAMLICFVSLAQQKTITGVVSDALGPLPGTTVVVKNTTRNTQTDFDGKYNIKASKGEILVFSYVGYTSKAV
ncbi:MAG TPA: carboxypeptidase-like regulatory domain-containing protein, partial [Flavobacterium sp.]|nr:carboxypeptidase-like regulatory domain-containing protein [Flavobacterium sp.]